MTVTAQGYAQSRQILFDQNAKPVVGGYLYVNAAGTTSLVSSYADATLSTLNPNPLRTDAFGRIPPIYFGTRVDGDGNPIDGAFKVVAQDASGAQLFVDDALPPGVDYDAKAEAAAQAAGAGVSGATTGDIKFKHGGSVDAGWLICNGNTIGNATSQGTGRAAADVQALFVYLWNNDASLAVANGRGVNATSDFNAGKTIALPDYRGRGPIGCDQMGGAGRANVITGATTATPDTPGALIGAEAAGISVAQLPTFTPQVTISNVDDHTHGAATALAGAHTPTFKETPHSHSTTINTQNGNVGTQSGGVQALNYSPNSTQGTGGSTTNIVMDAVPGHSHDVQVYGAGAHGHTATVQPIGSGQGHPNVQPGVLVYVHIKL